MMILPALLLGVVVALLRRPPAVAADDASSDAPLRVLRWTTGLLAAPRHEWGQAMLGELAHVEGSRRRWRFTLGCVSTALLLPPWGPVGSAAAAMAAIGVGGVGLYATVVVRYGLGSLAWVWAVFVSVCVVAFVLAAVALLRRPGVALSGLVGGAFVILAWLALSGFGFVRFLTSVQPMWAVLLLHVVVPSTVGVVATMWSGSAVAGRRAAGLAGLSAGLALFLYGTLALAAVGAQSPGEDGYSVRYIVADRLGGNVIFYLALLPLVTATLGWAASAAVARLSPRFDSNARAVVATRPLEPRTMRRALTIGLGVAAVLLVASTQLGGR